MKKLLIIFILALISTSVFGQAAKPDTTRYHFTESEVILIDNLMGQLDVVSGNSDKVSTAQYNSIHRAVMRIDSLIKVQYSKKHPVKWEGKKSN